MDKQKDNKIFEYFSKKSIALIGPSPILESSNMGEIIDLYDIVCRINHHAIIDPELYQDYGSKNNVIFPDGAGIPEFFESIKISQPDLVCYLRDIKYVKETREKIQNCSPKSLFYHAGDHYCKQFEESLEMHINTAWLALIFLTEMNTKQIYVSGFDFYQNEPWYHRKTKRRIMGYKGNGPREELNGFIINRAGHNQLKQLNLVNSLYKENKKIILDSTILDLIERHATN